jgi:hypothetical protein
MTMKKSKIGSSTLIALLVFSSVTLARERRGAEVVITEKDGTLVSGELIAVKKSSLLLLTGGSVAGTDLAVAWKDIRTVKIIKKSRFWKGLGYGLVIGGAGGAVIGLASGDDPSGFFNLTASDKAILGTIGLGFVGMILGGITGSAAGTDESISVRNDPESALQAIRSELAKHARIREIQ